MLGGVSWVLEMLLKKEANGELGMERKSRYGRTIGFQAEALQEFRVRQMYSSRVHMLTLLLIKRPSSGIEI